MNAINRHGAKGLARMGAVGTNLTSISAPRQETNVYVVQEKQRPPLGKNDILVAVHEDILQDGVTKKLVKQVAQGA